MNFFLRIAVIGITAMQFILPNVSYSALLGDFNSDGVVSISEVQTCINSFLGITQNVFTTAMISGKNFDFVSSDSSGSITFNADHTLSATHSAASGGGTSGGTWFINSSGQLITTFIADSGTYTSTITSSTATSITITQSWTKPSGIGSGTMTFTVASTTPETKVFTTVMINGRWFNYTTPDSSRTISFNSNKTFSSGSQSGTWSINSSGQLILSFSDNSIYTLTLTASTATSLTSTEFWAKSSGNGSDSIIFTGTVGI